MRELTQTWRDIFLGFRIALDPKKMLLGMVFGFLCIAMIMVTVTLFAGETSPLRDLVGETIRNPGAEAVRLARGIVGREWKEAAASPSAIIRYGARWLDDAHDWGRREWGGIAAIALAWTLLGQLFWTWFGLPLLRLSGVQYTRDETASFDDACGFSRGKRKSFFFAPLVPLIIVSIMLLVVLVVGWIGGIIPWIGPIAVSLFFPLAIITGLFVVLTLIGGIVGGCLMGPTIAIEGTDAFDAISRAFSYVYQRPWHFIWQWLVALVYGAVCIVFVVLVAMLSIWIPLGVGGWAMGERFQEIRTFLVSFYVLPDTFPLALAAILFKGWMILTYGLALGFIVSYFATQQSIIYCLMRKRVDGTEASEIYLEEEEEDFGDEPPADAAAPPEEEEEAEESSQDEQAEEDQDEGEDESEDSGDETEDEDQGENEDDENESDENESDDENAPAAAKKASKKKTAKKTKKKAAKKSTKKKSTKKSRKKTTKKTKKKSSGS